jgi:hypothetical protein
VSLERLDAVIHVETFVGTRSRAETFLAQLRV